MPMLVVTQVLGRAPVWALLHAEVPVHALLPVIVMVQEAVWASAAQAPVL